MGSIKKKIKINNSDNQLIINAFNRPISEDENNTTINDLPFELFVFIFEHLNLLNLQDCRLVCKLWKFHIDRIKITELILSGSLTYKWAFGKGSMNARNCINTTTLSSVNKCPFKLSNVKILSLNITIHKKELKILKLFPRVYHLEIEHLHVRGGGVCTLDLPELKKLFLYYIPYGRLSVNSRIDALSSLNLAKIDCAYPLDIKIIQIFDWLDSDVSIYKNVECLIFKSPNALIKLINNEIMLDRLQNLKEIKCFPDLADEHRCCWESGIDQLTEQTLLWKRKKNLKIYFDDIELIGAKRFEEYGFKL